MSPGPERSEGLARFVRHYPSTKRDKGANQVEAVVGLLFFLLLLQQGCRDLGRSLAAYYSRESMARIFYFPVPLSLRLTALLPAPNS